MDLKAMSAALEPTRLGLEAAGFSLALDEANGSLRLTVIASPEACEDCLVPKSLFAQMANDEIRQAGLEAASLAIVYPADGRPKR